jgi:alternative sigma factor RpoH
MAWLATADQRVTAQSGLTRYIEEIRRVPMLEPHEEYMLAKRWREHGDHEAAHKLVNSHLRLVIRIATGYRGYGLPISELISEGNVGLMQAVKRFEPEKGFRLATYAMWWIKAAIQEYILRSCSLVKMGTTINQKKLFFNLRKAKSKISVLDEGDLRPDQVKLIGRRLGVTEQDVVDMNRRLGGDVSLDAHRPGNDTRRKRGVRQPPQGPRLGALCAQQPGAAHLRGAPARRRTDHAPGACRRVRRLARARAPDRRVCLREGPEVGEEARRSDGNSGASAAALASNPLQWGKTADGPVAMSTFCGNRSTRKGYRSTINAPKFAS